MLGDSEDNTFSLEPRQFLRGSAATVLRKASDRETGVLGEVWREEGFVSLSLLPRRMLSQHFIGGEILREQESTERGGWVCWRGHG